MADGALGDVVVEIEIRGGRFEVARSMDAAIALEDGREMLPLPA